MHEELRCGHRRDPRGGCCDCACRDARQLSCAVCRSRRSAASPPCIIASTRQLMLHRVANLERLRSNENEVRARRFHRRLSRHASREPQHDGIGTAWYLEPCHRIAAMSSMHSRLSKRSRRGSPFVRSAEGQLAAYLAKTFLLSIRTCETKTSSSRSASWLLRTLVANPSNSWQRSMT